MINTSDVEHMTQETLCIISSLDHRCNQVERSIEMFNH